MLRIFPPFGQPHWSLVKPCRCGPLLLIIMAAIGPMQVAGLDKFFRRHLVLKQHQRRHIVVPEAPLELFPLVAPGERSPDLGVRTAPLTEELTEIVDNPAVVRCCPGDTTRGYLNVSHPQLVPYLVTPGAQGRSNSAIIVMPGGAGEFLAWEKEGDDIAQWLAGLGISAFVLKYRVPRRPWLETPLFRGGAALMDAQRAISLVRHRAKYFHVDPELIGCIGFSAGAALALDVSFTASRTYQPVDVADEESYQPNFQMLIYGAAPDVVILAEQQVQAPPTFLASASDDQHTPKEEVLATAGLLHDRGVPVELHMYPDGKHGYGRCTLWTDPRGGNNSGCQWTADCLPFLRQVGALAP